MEDQISPVVFCEWLKRRRKALDMTQGELAQRVGCSVGAVRKIESGDRRPSKQLARLFARALEIPEGDQPTFVRIARGELGLGRLAGLSLEPARTLPELSDLEPVHHRSTPDSSSTTLTHFDRIHRIPLQSTPLIGREAELSALERLFHDSQCRLLTLTGIGGIGKTRLAIEYGLGKGSEFPGGVFYFPLASVNSPEQVVSAIADVLGYGFSGPSDPKEQLLNYIASTIHQEALFIFDNLEHLLIEAPTREEKGGVVALITDILQRLANVKILGTSRERLNLYGEWIFELHGLSVPPTDFLGRLADYDSIALFVSRAQRTRPDFRVTPEEQISLIRIVQLVDGVPLAIELAAAWVCLLSCREIAQEIQANLDFLSTSMRDIPERHRSIRATFDHSWKLLSDEERWALCRISVFQGGFDREAARQIAGATLPLLASLSAKSLVRQRENERFDLHEVIRQYASSHMKQHPLDDDTRAEHAAYYLSIVRDSAVHLKCADQQATIRRLSVDIDNIRAAWVWAVDRRDFDLLEQAGRGFGWYFEITGLYLEGSEHFESLIQVLKAKPQDERICRLMSLALIHTALLLFRKGEFEHACQRYEESILILRPLSERALLADALVFLGAILHMKGEYQRSKSLQLEGLELAKQCGERWFEAWAIFNLGYIDSLTGRFAEGYEQMLAGLDTWRALGDPHAIALGLNFIVPTMVKLGHYDQAKAFMQESVALCEQTKNRWGLGTAYRHLGLAYLSEENFTEAHAHFQKSLEIFGQFSQGWDIARSLTYLGDAALMAGNLPEANQYYQEALKTCIDERLVPLALEALLGLGELASHAGEPDKILVLCYFILQHPSSEAETKLRVERLCKSVEGVLVPERIESALTLAQKSTFDRIVSEWINTSID